MHTEGKWEIRKWDGDEWPDKRISVGPPGIAVVISPRYESVNAMDDMHLIAAAPNLLEALEELRYQSMNLCTGKPARCFDETISRVDAAIAKAKGE